MNRREVITHITPIIKGSGYKVSKTYTKSKRLMQFHVTSDKESINVDAISKLNEKIGECNFFNGYIASFNIIDEELVLQIREK